MSTHTDSAGTDLNSPEYRRRLLAEATKLHRAGRFMEAEKLYRSILAAEPGHPDALHLLGLIAQEAGHPAEARRLIGRAIAASPRVAAYRANLAMVCEQQGDYAESIRAARAALELDPANGSALHCLANALRADDRYEEAANAYAKAARQITDDPALWSNYGATLLTLGRAQEAVEASRRALGLSPDQAELHSNLGNALAALGDEEAAAAAYREAMRIEPQFVPAYTNLAGLLLKSGDAAEAAAVLRQCLEIDPGNTKALAFLAAAAHEVGDDETRGRLVDFDRLVASRQIEAPPGYADLAAFNRALVEHVSAHGTLTWERITKTTRKGGQTGELLDASPGPIEALEGVIRQAVDEYIAALPDDPSHPFVGARPDEWTLTVWATVLGREGHQDAHIHPTGWLSGVYYAAVPPTDVGARPDTGWIEFGRPPDDMRVTRSPDVRTYAPRPGRMLLFPSYFHHRTVPWQGEGRRISIAFDVMPAPARTAGDVGRVSPSDAGAAIERARGLLQAGRLDEVEPLVERLLEAVPGEAAVHHLLGLVHYRRGRRDESVAALRRAVELAPDEPRYRLDLGTCAAAAGDEREAIAQYERVAELAPDNTDCLMRLAIVHGDGGRMEECIAAYERAIERNPTSGGAHYGLAMAKRFTPDDPHIRQMRALLERDDLAPLNEATIAFALGIALDQLDQVDEAMACYHRGNRIKRTLNAFDIGAERANTERLIRSFPAALFERRRGTGHPSERPVFVVGMPRSGTTLVEQILDSHPRVHGAGEINDLWRTVNGIGEWLPPGAALPEAVGDVDPAAWATLGARYVARLEHYSKTAARVVDKLPFNYTMIGLIRLMLPRARVVHCVRDPRDTCTSCYLTSFGNDRGFTSDLAELGETYRLYWRLMSHWRRVLPDMIHEVRYETLVDDLEGETRRLLAFLGLEWAPECLDFHANRRAVTTASMTQVRRPAYRTSIGRWRRYEAHLGPLLAALGDPAQYGIEGEPE